MQKRNLVKTIKHMQHPSEQQSTITRNNPNKKGGSLDARYSHFTNQHQYFQSVKTLYEAYTCNIGLTESTFALWHPFLNVILKLAKGINFLIDFREHCLPDNRTKISK